MDLKELLTGFLADAGMDETPVFEDGACHLLIEDRDIGFMETDDGSRLVVWSAVSSCPVERRDAFLMLLLRANFMGRMLPNGAFSLSDDDVVYAHCSFTLPVYDKEDFYRGLKDLLEAVEEWERLAELYKQVVVANPEGPDSEGAPLAGGGLGDWALGGPGLRV